MIKKEVMKKKKLENKPKDNLAFQLDEKMIGLIQKVNPLQLLETEDKKEQEEETVDFSLEEKTNLFDKIAETKSILSSAIFGMDTAFDLIEKLEKLLTWQDQDASTVVLVVILIAFFVVTFIPLRVIICLWLIGKFNKGSTWYYRKWIGNRECCKIETRNFFLDHKIYSFDVLFGRDEKKWLG